MRGIKIRFLGAVLLSAFILPSCARDSYTSASGRSSFYVREVKHGEIVPLDGPDRALTMPMPPNRVDLQEGCFALHFSLGAGRTRTVKFMIKQDSRDSITVHCMASSIAASKSGSYEDTSLDRAIRNQAVVNLPRDTWTVFFNDGLAGVFSSDWQIWWGDSAPKE